MLETQKRAALLAECAREPIRYPGKIQPHGALLVLSRPDLRVLCASENCAQFLDVELQRLLGYQRVMANRFDEAWHAARAALRPRAHRTRAGAS